MLIFFHFLPLAASLFFHLLFLTSDRVFFNCPTSPGYFHFYFLVSRWLFGNFFCDMLLSTVPCFSAILPTSPAAPPPPPLFWLPWRPKLCRKGSSVAINLYHHYQRHYPLLSAANGKLWTVLVSFFYSLVSNEFSCSFSECIKPIHTHIHILFSFQQRHAQSGGQQNIPFNCYQAYQFLTISALTPTAAQLLLSCLVHHKTAFVHSVTHLHHT